MKENKFFDHFLSCSVSLNSPVSVVFLHSNKCSFCNNVSKLSLQPRMKQKAVMQNTQINITGSMSDHCIASMHTNGTRVWTANCCNFLIVLSDQSSKVIPEIELQATN